MDLGFWAPPSESLSALEQHNKPGMLGLTCRARAPTPQVACRPAQRRFATEPRQSEGFNGAFKEFFEHDNTHPSGELGVPRGHHPPKPTRMRVVLQIVLTFPQRNGTRSTLAARKKLFMRIG
jgi:hypothetical protein